MSLLVKDILRIGNQRLIQAGISDHKQDSEELFCFCYHIERKSLFMNWSKEIDEHQCERYFSLLDLRCAGRPLQYITGHQEFMGLDFAVNEHVLIPRMDTEVLVERALAIIGDSERKIRRVLDLCTGSGAIAVSLAKLSVADITASDVSEEALATARKNAAGNQAKVSFACGDLFSPFRRKLGRTRFDLIVSNPPYIPTEEIQELQTEIRDHEPHLALDGGEDGLSFYRRIIEEAPDFLRKRGTLLLEIGFDQAEAVAGLARARGCYQEAEVTRDLAGLNRVVELRLQD